MPFDATKLWLKDYWSGRHFRDHRPTVNGGTVNPNLGKFYQVGTGYSGCFGCRCACTGCTLDPDTSIPPVIRVTWGVSTGCDCLMIGDADGTSVNLHFLDTPAFGPFYCCLQPPSYGSGTYNYGPCQKFWACTNDLMCYTDYQYIANPGDGSYMGVNCASKGTVMTDQLYNLQVSCLVLAYPNATTFSLDPTFGTDCSPSASPMWGGQIWVSIHSPGDSPFSANSGTVQWPDGTGETGPECDDGPPDFTPYTVTCGGGNGIAPHPSLWNGFGVRASGCDPCLCTISDWAVGPHNTGDSGTASLTSCNNFGG